MENTTVWRHFIGIWVGMAAQVVAFLGLFVGDFHDITVESTLVFGCKIIGLRLRGGVKSGWYPNYSVLGALSFRYLDFSLLLRRVQGVYKGCSSGVPAKISCFSGEHPLYTPCTRRRSRVNARYLRGTRKLEEFCLYSISLYS